MANSKKYSMIYYSLPEDNDDPNQPNAFTIPLNTKDITYTDIIKMFPLKGKFKFYFKYLHQKEFYWMEIKSNNTPLPICNKHIWMRVERIKEQIKPQENQSPQVQQDLSDLIQF